MDSKDLELRTLLVAIGDKLSNENRVMLGFLLRDDVPRRELDDIVRDSRVSMVKVWEALIDRQKITPDNLDYLINRFNEIQRIDLVRQLQSYVNSTHSEYSTAPTNHATHLFKRYNP
jgi:hypothetical protein